jgi:hypothetical protein
MTTNKIYEGSPSGIQFGGTTHDVAWTLAGVGTAGRCSAQWPRAAGSLPPLLILEANFQWAATPAAGEVLRVYGACGMTTTSADYVADADITPEALLGNFDLLGQVIVKAAAVGPFKKRLIWFVGDCRYINLAIWNASTTALGATTTSWITVYESYGDIQAAA